MKEKKKLGLVPKLIIAIILGILIGQFLPEEICRIVVTLSGLFSSFPEIRHSTDDPGLCNYGNRRSVSGAGKLLLITVALAYGSTLIAGTASFLVSINLFPSFMSADALDQIAATADASLSPYFSISLQAILDTLSAVALAFILGLCLSSMRGKQIGNSLYNGMAEFSKIIDKVLHTVIIPLLPLYICGTFVDMTKSGKTFAILSYFVEGIPGSNCYASDLYSDSVCDRRTVSKKNPFELIKNQVPGYTTALGTQSSAATIPSIWNVQRMMESVSRSVTL